MSKLGRFIRRKWAKRIVRGLFALIILLVVSVFVARYYILYQGKQQLSEQTASLDANDPRWRWEDIEADRPAIPDAENSAQLLPKLKATLGDRERVSIRWPDGQDPFDSGPPNKLLSGDQLELVKDFLSEHDEAIAVADQFQHYSRGRHSLRLSPEIWVPSDSSRCLLISAINLLDAKAELHCVNGKPDEALQLIGAMLNVERSLDMEPALFSQALRVSFIETALSRLERVLALHQSTPALTEV